MSPAGVDAGTISSMPGATLSGVTACEVDDVADVDCSVLVSEAGLSQAVIVRLSVSNNNTDLMGLLNTVVMICFVRFGQMRGLLLY